MLTRHKSSAHSTEPLCYALFKDLHRTPYKWAQHDKTGDPQFRFCRSAKFSKYYNTYGEITEYKRIVETSVRPSASTLKVLSYFLDVIQWVSGGSFPGDKAAGA
jgi:hypothetical protein